MAFINRFGYRVQRSTKRDFLTVAEQAHHLAILQNLVQELDKLGLRRETEARNIVWAVKVVSQKSKGS